MFVLVNVSFLFKVLILDKRLVGVVMIIFFVNVMFVLK